MAINLGQRFAQTLQNLQSIDSIQQNRQRAPLQNRLLELGVELQEAQQPVQLQQLDRASSPLSQFQMDQQQLQQIGISTAQSLKPAFDSNNRLGVISGLTNTLNQMTEIGAPSDVIASIQEDIQQAQTPQGFEQLRQENESLLQVSGITAMAQAQTASQRDFQTFKRLENEAKATPSTDDDIAAEQFGRQAGFVRPTEKQKADIKVSEAERKEIAKSNAKRKQGFIDSGVEAADSVANIKRSIALLDTVKTGGLDRASFRIRQAFGVEGADEGELSANLGRSVLAQLKPIFGAAFTAAEGERLERIEAGFGRSPETNKRLLSSALKIAERASRRGLAAAEDQGDEFTANEIREAMAFEFEDPETPIKSVVPASQFQEGQTATNPQTGEKLIFRNGNWGSLNG